MTRTEKHAAIIKHYETQGYVIVRWKGGYWIQKECKKTFVKTADAAKAAGIVPTRRSSRIALPWGDYATIAMLNRPRR